MFDLTGMKEQNFYNLGIECLADGHIEDAVESFRTSLTINPKQHESHYGLALSHFEAKRLTQAMKCAKEALRHGPNFIDAYCLFAEINLRLGQFANALIFVSKATLEVPNHGVGLAIKGWASLGIGRHDRGMQLLLQAFASEPQNPKVQALVAEGLCYAGEHQKALNLIKRWPLNQREQVIVKSNALQLWNGEDLTGRSLLILGSETSDDYRYLPLIEDIADKAKEIVWYGVSETGYVLQELGVVDRRIDQHQQVPKVDYVVALQDIAFILKRLEHPTKSKFLQDKELSKSLSTEIRIGIGWQDLHPSNYSPAQFDLASFIEQTAHLAGVQFHSLESELKKSYGKTLPKNWTDSGANLKSPSDKLNLLRGMDLVISTDNITLHLAGAINKKCLGIMPYAASKLWTDGVETTHWYETITLMRQTQRARWSDIVSRVIQWIEN